MVVLILTLVIVGAYRDVNSQSSSVDTGFALVDKTGNIHKPSGYRDDYESL